MNVTLKILILFLANALADGPSWSYPETDKWPENCKKGEEQSPIDITDYDAEIVKYPQLKLFNYDKPVKCNLINDGHTVKFTLPKYSELYVSGGDLTKKYMLKQIHFHWKSEHRFSGKQYPLEAHFVHVSNDQRHRRGADFPNDLLVLSVLFYINKYGNSQVTDVFDSWQHVTKVGDADIATIVPKSLLPLNLDTFYRYKGSLTTPNCNENVQWLVFESKVPISAEKYQIVKNTATFNGTDSENFRGVKPLYGRVIKHVYASSGYRRYPTLLSVSIWLIAYALRK